jgi:pyridoxal 5'-phosphate synthase pdxT subunit
MQGNDTTQVVDDRSSLLIGVLALQGAFEEHETSLHAIGCHNTRQVRTVQDLIGLDGIILPGGESTAMGLIGTTTSTVSSKNMWESLQEFPKPIWGTCAGMILLAEQCIGTSAVIQDGQALIGGMNVCVARNYFGSQVSSFEMPIPGPPPILNRRNNGIAADEVSSEPFPGIFIRAPAILTAGPDVEVLGTVVATPCRQAAITLQELDRKIASGENVIKLGVVDAIERKIVDQRKEIQNTITSTDSYSMGSPLRYKSTATATTTGSLLMDTDTNTQTIELPGAADGTNARKVICAARKGNLLCTAFHPELTDDYRWHEYFVLMVLQSKHQPIKY